MSVTSPKEGEVLWTPSSESMEQSQMEIFRRKINAKYHLSLKHYGDLHRWSTDNYPVFWAEVWDVCQIIHSQSYEKVCQFHAGVVIYHQVIVDERLPIDEFPTWFPGARLNFAENLLRYRDDHPAIIYESTGLGSSMLLMAIIGEYGSDRRSLTFKELHDQTAKVAAALRNGGLKTDDVVAAYAANVPEVVIFMLAAVSIGASFTTIPPEFGVSAVKDRLIQTRPKILLASEAVYYNGRMHDQMAKIDEIHQDIPSLNKIVVLESQFDMMRSSRQFPEKCVFYRHFIKAFVHVNEMAFEQLPFDHPLYILYSSGTTGMPKCLVHSAGGTLVQHLKEHMLHGDLRRADVFIQYTTIGWMMWHWLVSSLAIGCTIVLYEGSPFRPTMDQLLGLISSRKITRFGISAKYIQHLQESDYQLVDWDLSSLKTIYSTGSPLSPLNFRFIHQRLKKDVQVASITGGTDIISLFGAPNPLLPVYAGEVQCAGLGMAITAFSEDGTPTNSGEAGDLVCLCPFPSMPIYFLNDPNKERYRAAYMDRFKHVWHHGDFVQFNSTTGGIVMLGRSDGTLNPAGVRFGSAELYNTLTMFPEIIDSLVVGVKRVGESDERVIMFIKTASCTLDAELVARIKTEIRSQLSPRHVPSMILYTPAVPYTLNGKKVEVAVKRILSAQNDISFTSLANPESLEYYRELAKTI